MNPREEGFLLLTSHLGNSQRKPLTIPQFRILAEAVSCSGAIWEDREMEPRDLMALGFTEPSAQRIVDLLSEREQLLWYLQKGKLAHCHPTSRVSSDYPVILRQRLGVEAPGCLWAKGDMALLKRPGISLVGSRELREDNAAFAWEVGKQAALQGFNLISGNARGADQTAQEGCLTHGGCVISVVADSLEKHRVSDRILYLSEDSFDAGFTAQRALSRNRIIHSLGAITFVAQSRAGAGGTWSGTQNNLKKHLSPVFCFDDGSEAAGLFAQMGAMRIGIAALADLPALQKQNLSIFDQ